MAIRVPGLTPRVTNALVETLDLFPTVLDLAQCPTTTKPNGRSLVPILEEKATQVRDYILSEVHTETMGPHCNSST